MPGAGRLCFSACPGRDPAPIQREIWPERDSDADLRASNAGGCPDYPPHAFTRGAHEMGRGSRIGSYILGLGMILGLVIGQLAIAEGLLVEGGAMPG